MSITNQQIRYKVVKEFTAKPVNPSDKEKIYKVGDIAIQQEDLDSEKGVVGLYLIDNGIKYQMAYSSDTLVQIVEEIKPSGNAIFEKLGITKKNMPTIIVFGSITVIFISSLVYLKIKNKKSVLATA